MGRKIRRFGKYRATVVNNLDPQGLARLQLLVPDVHGIVPAPWAMPCAPVATENGGMIAIPPVGASVWVEFERGDEDLPIWVGGFWSAPLDCAPTVSPTSLAFALQTPGGHSLVISDAPGPAGGITLRTATGAAFTFNETGVHISNGQGATISMAGPLVSVNNGALEVL